MALQLSTQGGGGDAVEYVYGSAPQSPASPKRRGSTKPSSPSGGGGRTEGWVVMTPSPGPGAYNPSIAPVVTAAERAVFGTAYRDQEERRFLSHLHNAGMPNPDTPGPGAYRTADNRLIKNEKSAKFGTAPQRPEVSKESLYKPGAVYDLPSTLSTQAVSFGTPTSILRASLSARINSPLKDPRSAQSERFPLDHIDGPGPDAYPLIPTDKLAQHETAPKYSFGRASREAATRASLTPAQLAADSTVSTALATPAAVYDIPSMPPPSQVTVFPRGPAHYNPEKGGNSKGPYLGRLHEDAGKGIDSPGPGSYAPGNCLQTSGGAKFGPAPPSRTPKPNEVEVPGPGAHNPNFSALSVRPNASAYSMGANLRTDWSAFSPPTPGPAAYALPPSDRTSNNLTAPAYSMGATAGNRLSHVARNSNPSPDAYGRPEDPRDRSSIKKGFSFGLKERARAEGTIVTNRYHGPLHAQEGMGTESPGPGCYEVPLSIPSPGTRFGTSGRDAGSKVYISHMHAAAEGYGTASPGPGCYNVADAGNVGSPNRFKTKLAPKFGTSPRFSDKVCTK